MIENPGEGTAPAADAHGHKNANFTKKIENKPNLYANMGKIINFGNIS